MAKKESSFFQLVFSLTLISLFAASALAAVYSVTKGPIEQSIVEKKSNAIQLVLPGFDSQKGSIKTQKVLIDGESDSVTIYIAELDNKFYGAAVETFTNKAFSGRFDIMVGFDKEGIMLGSEVLKHNETPGLGDKISKTKSEFPNQFNGKNPSKMKLAVKKDGGDVDAITAATISSRAFCDAVDRANKAYLIVKETISSNSIDSTSNNK